MAVEALVRTRVTAVRAGTRAASRRARTHAGALWQDAHPLGVLSWALLTCGVAAAPFLERADKNVERAALLLLGGVFFALQLLRLGRALHAADPARRTQLSVLLVSIGLWSVGAIVVTIRNHGMLSGFPNPGAVLYLLAYVGMTGYLVLSSGGRSRDSVTAWLDALVICGATVCVATSFLLLPGARHHAADAGRLLGALLFPLLDLMLAMLVLAQVVLKLRGNLARSLPLSLAFLLLAYADLRFGGHVASATGPAFSLPDDAAWTAGFTLLVGSACRPNEEGRPATARFGVLVGAASALAVFVLAFRPSGELGRYVAVPAALTLLGVGGRLVFALRDAHRAVEALARSHTDDLTRLPNRRALRERIDASIAAGARLALVVLDLDGFKEINDTLGHLAGDHVLERAGARIRESVPALASVARLGGDEFGILAPRGDTALMLETAREVLAALGEPLHVDGLALALGASVGIVEWSGEDDIDSNELVRRAEVAMYRAKQARSGIALYDAFHDEYSMARLRIAEELRRGLQNGEIEVWYQPQIDATTLRPCALEALVRWRHPTDGLLTPVAFLSAARRAGLMPLLSQEVVRLAVADVARWHAAGLRLRVAINCAPPELLSGVFVPRLHEAMDEAGVPPNSFVLEVTEESFIAEPERAREILQGIRGHGVQVAIDDYGTGFSSLAYLRDLPVDELKLDRTFVSPIGTDERSRMIVASTVQMARALGLRTVAEGVEDAATAADLIAMGVGALQGYHISRPMPAGEVLDWIVQWPTFADVRVTAGAAPESAEPAAAAAATPSAPGAAPQAWPLRRPGRR